LLSQQAVICRTLRYFLHQRPKYIAGSDAPDATCLLFTHLSLFYLKQAHNCLHHPRLPDLHYAESSGKFSCPKIYSWAASDALNTTFDLICPHLLGTIGHQPPSHLLSFHRNCLITVFHSFLQSTRSFVILGNPYSSYLPSKLSCVHYDAPHIDWVAVDSILSLPLALPSPAQITASS
jgi:hypothetical protein